MANERSWRLNAFLVVALGVGLFVVLLVRPPFELPANSVPTGVSVGVEIGTTGAETDESGVFWWITTPDAAVRVANNDAAPATIEVSFVLVNGPCPVERDVQIDGQRVALEPGGSQSVVIQPIELAGYERRQLVLRVAGAPCPPSELDPRDLYVNVRQVEVVEVGP